MRKIGRSTCWFIIVGVLGPWLSSCGSLYREEIVRRERIPPGSKHDNARLGGRTGSSPATTESELSQEEGLPEQGSIAGGGESPSPTSESNPSTPPGGAAEGSEDMLPGANPAPGEAPQVARTDGNDTPIEGCEFERPWKSMFSNEAVKLKSRYMAPVFGPINFELIAAAGLGMFNQLTRLGFQTSFRIKAELRSITPPVPDALTSPFVDGLTGPVGTEVTGPVPDEGPWSNIRCSTRPVSVITFKTTRIRLHRPIPFVIYPASADLLLEELPDPVVEFADVTAQVETADPSTQAKVKASVQLAPRIYRIEDNEDTLGFRVEFLPKARVAEMTYKLGLPFLAMSYYIDRNKRTYRQVEIEAVLNVQDKLTGKIAVYPQ